jgi:hypothetical protein
MHHGRAALVVQALEACGQRTIAARARRRLARDVELALSGRPLDGWPDDPRVRAGSLALAILAGVEAEQELARLAKKTSLDGSAWHAAQVVVALRGDAPQTLYDACITDLDARPWAPWTALAAHARGDAAVLNRCATELARSVREVAPHCGGVGFREVPEVALTAIVVEALATCTDPRSREACVRGRGFLLQHQNRAGRTRGPIDPVLADGGFPLTPVNDILRSDVTAHALLALSNERRMVR